jgi:hypothetical protein
MLGAGEFFGEGCLAGQTQAHVNRYHTVFGFRHAD